MQTRFTGYKFTEYKYMPLLKSYVKEESPFPPLNKVSLTGQVCALAAGVNVRQHPVISQNSRRKANAEGESLKTPWYRRPGH